MVRQAEKKRGWMAGLAVVFGVGGLLWSLQDRSGMPTEGTKAALTPPTKGDESAPAPGARAVDLVRGIERAARFFDSRPLRGDQALFITSAARAISDDFVRWASALKPDPEVADQAAARDPNEPGEGLEGILWNDRARKHLPWPPLPKPQELAPLPDMNKLSDEELREFYDLMVLILRCDGSPHSQEALHAVLARPRKGYLLTHQLFGASWAREHACLDDARTLSLRASLAARVLREYLGDPEPGSDLQVERMAVLCFSGLCSWVDEAHVQHLLRTQQEDGSWGSRPLEVNASVVFPAGHTAALALYTLVTRWAEHIPPLPAPRPPH